MQGEPELRRYTVYQNLRDTGCSRRRGKPFKLEKDYLSSILVR